MYFNVEEKVSEGGGNLSLPLKTRSIQSVYAEVGVGGNYLWHSTDVLPDSAARYQISPLYLRKSIWLTQFCIIDIWMVPFSDIPVWQLTYFCFDIQFRDQKCNIWEQDSSPTRQFTDTVFEDSSPTDLKTVHRHFWRHFIDTFLSRFWHMAKKWLLWRNMDELWFEVICWYNLLRKRYFVRLIKD